MRRDRKVKARAKERKAPSVVSSKPSPIYRLAENVGAALKSGGLMLVTAESCTGGWVAEAVTMVPGRSEWFERGFVTYTHISKREMLDVSSDTLGKHGDVSEPTVREMVTGALNHS